MEFHLAVMREWSMGSSDKKIHLKVYSDKLELGQSAGEQLGESQWNIFIQNSIPLLNQRTKEVQHLDDLLISSRGDLAGCCWKQINMDSGVIQEKST